MSQAYVDRRHIAYAPPFHVETFGTGFVIGCDSLGYNCVRFDDGPPGHVGCDDEAAMQAAVDALNAQPVSDFMTTQPIETGRAEVER